MKAVVLTGPEKIGVEEVPVPAIGRNELLVKMRNCGICTLEQRLYSGAMVIHYPLIPGHEAAGEVVEVGSDVISDIAPGARVALDLVVRCGECYYCRSGQSNMCMNRLKKGQKVLGGFAEYIAVKATQAYRLGDAVTFPEAAFSEPLSCCIRSLKKAALRLSDDLLIVGAGPMGQMHLQVALCMGARVFVSDPDTARLALAKKMGAYLTIDPTKEDLPTVIKAHTEGRGADACVVTSAAPSALNGAFASVRKNGRVNIYTSYTDKPPLPVDANTLHRTELTITANEGRMEEDYLQSVRLLSFGKVNVKPLISTIVSFVDIEKGIKAAMTPETYRVLLGSEGA
jgi:2-desacetyl-2-hydroxyethyl bacteriochlorophyllide A dehydrogenase